MMVRIRQKIDTEIPIYDTTESALEFICSKVAACSTV